MWSKKCTTKWCHSYSMGSNRNYCLNCECDAFQCYQPKTPGNKYCVKHPNYHKCEDSRCLFESVKDKKYCKGHHCLTLDCFQAQMKNSSYCVEHQNQTTNEYEEIHLCSHKIYNSKHRR